MLHDSGHFGIGQVRQTLRAKPSTLRNTDLFGSASNPLATISLSSQVPTTPWNASLVACATMGVAEPAGICIMSQPPRSLCLYLYVAGLRNWRQRGAHHEHPKPTLGTKWVWPCCSWLLARPAKHAKQVRRKRYHKAASAFLDQGHYNHDEYGPPTCRYSVPVNRLATMQQEPVSSRDGRHAQR